MLETRPAASAHGWQNLIEDTAGDRCDFDILLKDEWRHKITVRDDPPAGSPVKEQSFITSGQGYSSLRKFLRNHDGISLGAVVLTAIHSVLGAYGQGTRTVLAYVDAMAKDASGSGRVLPTIIDNLQQSDLTRVEAVRTLESALRRKDMWTEPAEVFHRGLFDAVVVLASRDHLPSEIPLSPLAWVVRNDELEQRLQWTVSYAGSFFEDSVIAGVLEVVQEVFRQIVSDPAGRLRDLELISADQKRQLEAWNATDGDFPKEKRLNILFEDAAGKTPEFEALVCGDTRLTYRELNELCNWFSRRLASSANVKPGEIVAIFLDKCHLIVVATLSLWKAGAAYVPIDPGYPAERILYTLGDTEATHIITNSHHSARLRELLSPRYSSVQVLEIETELEARKGSDLPLENPQLPARSDEIAYITYTSGTTGVPKGVAKIHSNVVNSITDLSERYGMLQPGEERVALMSAFVFEPFMRQTLIALINSQRLIVVPDELRTAPHRFAALVARHGITYLNGTGSILQHFDLRGCHTLKRMLLVGEELTPGRLRQIRENFGGQIINEYSFTETAFVTTIKVFAPGVTERADRSIGRPLRNVKCYVLAENLKQVPIGAVGELYIGGRGIANGYLNQERLTAEKFLPNLFQTEQDKLRGHNAFIYKTGDLARMLPNGEIEFMGRADFQLKLNGVRVEPGEIEARALEYPGMRQCIVVPVDGPGGWRLVGYFVADPACEINESELLAFLEERLIRVMVPARMVQLPVMPVNVNGKIDRRALPQVNFQGSSAMGNAAGEGSAVPASNHLPDVLREIWGTVLGVPMSSIHIRDDFFRLGGQSITCIQLLMRIWRRLRLAVTVEDMFRLKTLANLADHLKQMQKEAAESGSAGKLEEAAATRPVRLLASGLQQGLMYHALKSSPDDDAYVMQSVYRYHRPVNPELLKQAWELAQRKYPGLRLRFEWENEAAQIIEPEGKPLNWRFVDLSGVADATLQEKQIRELQQGERMQPYVLSAGGLFRLVLIKQREDLFSLILSYHHIILDGWSLPVLLDNVHRMYLLLTQMDAFDPVADTAYLEAQRYSEAHRGDHVEYWMSQIERITEHGDFGGLLNRNSRYKVSLSTYDQVMEHRTKRLSINARHIKMIKAECARHQLTLHSVLQFVWHKMLYGIGGGRTTVVGTVVSGRNLPVDGIEESVGLFINTLPLIVDHGDQEAKTVAEAIADIQDTVNRMNSRSIVELGRLQSGEAKRRLFDTLLVLENYPRLLSDEETRRQDELLRFEWAYDSDKVDYPIAVVAREKEDELTINLWYAGELFDDTAIETIIDTVQTLFSQIAESFSQTAGGLEYISPAVQNRFAEWNNTDAPFPENQTLESAFEQAAGQWPGVTAVVYENVSLTYRELNQRANQLAHYLLATVELHPNDLVALVMDKSEWLFVSILAVWKTGAAYVPIDPGYPDDRVMFMLEDTRAKLVIADAAHSERLRGLSEDTARPVLSVQDLPLHAHPHGTPAKSSSATDLAYAIYTSGTTGKPKAVLVEHRGVRNLHSSLAKTFALLRGNADEAILSFSNYIFDHFVEQMTDALLSGQTLVVLNDEMRTDKARLYRYMNDNRVTYLSGTPSVLSLYEFSTVPSLTRIDAIGEDFTIPVFNKIRETFAGMIINGYGPTEISITSHKRPYGTGEPRLDKSIGFPVDNTRCYVLNTAMKRVPVGGIGELYIGGVGVARGYLNRDELTAERFLNNPFQTEDEKRLGINARMYKTGDLVRWLPNGELEYLGRNDLQVKIRGQRVELGEIEEVLASYPGVSRALIIAREHGASANGAAGQKYLAGFYLSDGEIAEQDILLWMRMKLPQAIVPVRVLRISEIPVTKSGKLDVTRLPQTDFIPGDGADYLTPSSDLQIQLCRIWSNVLGVAPELLGVRDDFFGLGGDSLRAIKLAQSITGDVGRVLGVGDVFKYRTIESQADHIQENAAARDLEQAFAEQLSGSHTGDLPVSLAQERLLFIDDFVGDTFAYNIPFVLEITLSSTVSRNNITAALRTLVRRHPALRTLLRGKHGGVRLQHVLDQHEVLAKFEIRELEAGSRSELDKILVAESEHVFRLDEELPIRVCLVALAGDSGRVYLSIVTHHSAFDGWSWNVFRRELQAFAAGVPESELPLPRASYADFTLWQRDRLSGDRLSALTAFWTKALAGFEPLNLLPDQPPPPQFDYRGREIFFDLDAATTQQLKNLARTARVSFYTVLFGAYCFMLKTWTGQRDIITGTPSANRVRPEFEGVIGFFTNLLVLRVRMDGVSTLLNYLRSVGETVIQAQVHQELPFEQLVKSLRITKDPSRHPIIQTVFNLLNNDDAPDTGAGLEMKNYVPDNEGWTTAKFDLTVTLTKVPSGLAGNFTYAASLFHDATITHFISSFKHILKEFARLQSSASTAKVSDVTCVDEDTRAELLTVRNLPAAHSVLSESRTLHHVFEEMAERWPSEVAVTYGSTLLSYRELNERANQLAHQLLAITDLPPNDLVALMMDKSEWMIVVILAVWKAGAAYVPIDPRHPDDRVAFMLEDTASRLVIADEVYCERLRQLSGVLAPPILSVSQLSLDEGQRSNPVTPVTGGNLAYAIYTSGTTGKPKAVLVQHDSVVSLVNDLPLRYFGEAGPQQAVLFLANYVFDFSIEQFALSILSGHKLVIPASSEVIDDEFYEYLNRNGLTYISGTPTQMQQFDLSRLKHLKIVLVAGEAFQPYHFEKFRREYSGLLMNAYGTTETTVYNTVKVFDPGSPFRNAIGDPLLNTQLFVLGSELQLLPLGAVGELCISGECVSAGYLNQPELNQERFVANPFQTEIERSQGRCAVIYRTGDLVRLRLDGELEFLGRNDSQVKIHGLRIEVREIEAVLGSYPGVRQCAVVVREDQRSPGSKYLAGYYVGETPAIKEEEVAAFLRARLMPGMVPAQLIRFDGVLPVTINGKLDTDALPVVDFSADRIGYEGPRSRMEARLCEMWSTLLPGAAIGVNNDFFLCGGDSIMALQLAAQVQREFKRKISVKQIFDFPTVRTFVSNVLDLPADELLPQPPDSLTGSCPLLPVQEWFFAKPLRSRNLWNQYFAIRTPQLEPERLRGALDRLVAHHDAFALRFRSPSPGQGGEAEQFYSEDRTKVLLHTFDVKGMPAAAVQKQLEAWQSGFDLEHGPLACAAYLHGFEDGSARVWFALHHLIVDVVSWRIIAQDLEVIYNGGDLGPRGASYRQWAQAVQNYPAGDAEVQFWSEIADGIAAEARTTALTAAGNAWSREQFELSEEATQRLLTESNRAYQTHIDDLLLTALGGALSALTWSALNYVTVEGHGRESFQGAPDVGNTVGWFTSMHPIALETGKDWGSSIALTRNNGGRAPHHGLGYGAVRGRYGSSRAPIPPVSFNFLGQFSGSQFSQPLSPPAALADSGPWTLDMSMCGTMKAAGDELANDSVMDVTMQIAGSRLVAQVDSRLSASDVKRFAAEFRKSLEEIIDHTAVMASGQNRHAVRPLPDEDHFDPYIIVNEEASGETLFLLPPGEGGAESYLNNIARQLPGIRLVLFNNIHLRRPMHSFEALAQFYLPHVRRLQLSGPYNFLGWSFGAVLSLEMSLELARAGERISNLILIDPLLNVRKAGADMGHPGVDKIFDPINYRYMPAEADLKQLRLSVGNVVLFKAARPSREPQREEERKFFEYYAQSPSNNLDTLLPPSAFSVELLADNTHFSWVRDERTVAAVSSRTRALMRSLRQGMDALSVPPKA